MITPMPNILKDVPYQSATEYYKGSYIADTLTELGAPCYLVKEICSPQVVTYHLNLDDPMDINKLKRPISALGAMLHCRINMVSSNEAHFALVMPVSARSTVYFREELTSQNFCNGRERSRLCALLGRGTDDTTLTIDLAKIPHILIAGATGSGKSVCLNTIISSILFNATPQELQLVMIDPKKVEFSIYDGLPHLAVPVIKDYESAVKHLRNLCAFMDKRYQLMSQKHAKNASEIGLPSMIIVIDELADLMLVSRYEVEEYIIRLAQLGRAAGIHLIIATQRPTVNVITGLIKSNMPCKIALQTSSIRDSMNILDHKGAESLTGRGDALLKLPDRVEEVRFQSAYIDTDDIQRIVKYWFLQKLA